MLACLAATWFLWGTMYLAIKWALVSFPPFYQMGSQFVVAGIVRLASHESVGRLTTARQWLGGAVLERC